MLLVKFGNFVIIENKLDNSEKDGTWQVIKFASYCGVSLTNQYILKIYQDFLRTSAIKQVQILSAAILLKKLLIGQLLKLF